MNQVQQGAWNLLGLALLFISDSFIVHPDDSYHCSSPKTGVAAMPAPCQRNKKPLYYVNTFRKYKGFCVNEQRGGAGIAALYASLLTARVSRAAILKLGSMEP